MYAWSWPVFRSTSSICWNVKESILNCRAILMFFMSVGKGIFAFSMKSVMVYIIIIELKIWLKWKSKFVIYWFLDSRLVSYITGNKNVNQRLQIFVWNLNLYLSAVAKHSVSKYSSKVIWHNVTTTGLPVYYHVFQKSLKITFSNIYLPIWQNNSIISSKRSQFQC